MARKQNVMFEQFLQLFVNICLKEHTSMATYIQRNIKNQSTAGVQFDLEV